MAFNRLLLILMLLSHRIFNLRVEKINKPKIRVQNRVNRLHTNFNMSILGSYNTELMREVVSRDKCSQELNSGHVLPVQQML
jgi:hypothetical protein